MKPDTRRLCVFFTAGATRYAIDAVRVAEVLRPTPSSTPESGAMELPYPDARDLSLLLGGSVEQDFGAAVVIGSPRGDGPDPIALRVRRVDGVFDAGPAPRWPVQGRLVPLISPAVGAAIEFEGRLVFELDADGVARGLPRQEKPIERHERQADQALVFTVQQERLAVPLHHVVQVIEAGAQFNRSPNAGTFLGVALHRAQLCPVFTVGPLGLVMPYVVIFEVHGELLGLSATHVEGVRSKTSLDGVSVLDVGRMFS
ncbi:MAG: hypothetical protein U0228_12355 [Myxococcaceae bacterium]